MEAARLEVSEIGNRVVQLRNKYSLTRREFSTKAKITIHVLYNLEFGRYKKIPQDVLMKIVNVFGTTGEWMLFGKGEMLPCGFVGDVLDENKLNLYWKSEAFQQLEYRNRILENENHNLWRLVNQKLLISQDESLTIQPGILRHNPSRLVFKTRINKPISLVLDMWIITNCLNKWFTQSSEFLSFGSTVRGPKSSAKSGDMYNWLLDKRIGENLTGEVIFNNNHDFIKFSFKHNTNLSVLITDLGNISDVEITHEGFSLDNSLHASLYVLWCARWPFYLCNLKSVSENGIDLRNSDGTSFYQRAS